MPKRSVAGFISNYLKEHHVIKSVDKVLNKMRYLEDKYKDVKDFLHATSEGLSSEDEKMAISTTMEKVYQKCPFYDIINPIMKDSVSITLPYVGESGISENISDMLFSDSTLQGDLETLDDENYAASRTSRSSENSCFPYVFHRLVVSCKFCSICFAKFVRQI
jgi:hypothetical protein